MQTSKIFLTSILSLNLLALAACNLPKPKTTDSAQQEDTPATFFITEAKGTSLKANLAQDTGLPQSKTFNFSVCLKDRAQSHPLVGHPFRVEELKKDLKTDEKGCLNWSEDVPFNYSSTPKYLEWKRKITATGLHRGTRTAQFAINPWNDNDGSDAVVNLENYTPPRLVSDSSQIQQALKGAAVSTTTAQVAGKTPLWVNDVKVQSTEQKFDQNGVVLNYDLAIAPQMIVSAINGERILKAIPQGNFKTKIYLIHSVTEGDKEVRLVLAESQVQTSSISGNTLFVKAPMSLAVLPTRGQLLLGLDISSTDDARLGRFQGIYTIGEYDQLKSAGMLRMTSTVTSTENFQIAEYMTTTLSTRLSEHPDSYIKPRIEIAPLEFKYVRVGKETTSEREIVYNIKACFRNGLEQKTTRGYTFNVTGFRQNDSDVAKTTKITTDNSSCINWDETFTFKYYECQKFIKGFIDIENKELSMKQRLPIAMNPWESWGTFARDLRYVDAQEQLLTDCKQDNVLPSTLSLRSFSYSTISDKREIDSQLNMIQKKKLRFKLDAAVAIYSDMAKGRMESAQKLRPGVYLLKLALIKNRDYYNQKTYVASAEKLVSSLDGDIKTDIEFKSADLKGMGDRNTLLVELDPVQESKVTVDAGGNIALKDKVTTLDDVIDSSTGLYNRTFSAPMILTQDKDGQDLTAVDSSSVNQFLTMSNLPKLDTNHKSLVREYIQFGQQLEAQAQQQERAQGDITAFAKNNDLKLIFVSNSKGYEDLGSILSTAPTKFDVPTINSQLNQVAMTGKLNTEITKGLCAYWFRSFITKDLWDFYGQHALVNCGIRANQPEKIFSVEKRLFVKELSGYNYLKGDTATVSVGNSLTLTRSQTHTTTHMKTLNFNAGVSWKFADIFSLGMTGSYSISQSDAKAAVTANAATVNINKYLLLQEFTFQLNFKRYQECAIIKVNPTLFMKNGIFAGSLNPHLTEGEKAAVATRGLMVCRGPDTTTPITRTENYYQLNQDNTSVQSPDIGDEHNRNFFVAVRGEREFGKLMYYLKGTIKTPQSEGRDNDDRKTTFDGIDFLFKSGHSNVPGSYNDTH